MIAAPARLETERLILERISAEHEAVLTPILRDPRVAAWLTDDGRPPGVEAARRRHAEKLAHWKRYGFGLWLARERATGTAVGRGGLQHPPAAEIDEVELAWALAPAYWGRGLATELARAAVGTAFGTLELDRVVALTTPENAASKRVMVKLGMRFDRTLRHLRPPLVVYVLERC